MSFRSKKGALDPYRAKCEVCRCSWNQACDPPCSWDPDFWAAGRAVCTNPKCLKKAEPLE